MKNIKKLNVIILLILLLFITGCEKSIELDPDISNCSHQWEIEKEYSIHDTKYLIGYKKCKKCGYIETPLNVDQSCCEIHQWKLLSSTDEKDVYSCEICKYEREEIKTTNIKYLKDKMNKSLFEDIFYVKFDNNEDSFQIENDEKTELKSIIDKMLECEIVPIEFCNCYKYIDITVRYFEDNVHNFYNIIVHNHGVILRRQGVQISDKTYKSAYYLIKENENFKASDFEFLKEKYVIDDKEIVCEKYDNINAFELENLFLNDLNKPNLGFEELYNYTYFGGIIASFNTSEEAIQYIKENEVYPGENLVSIKLANETSYYFVFEVVSKTKEYSYTYYYVSYKLDFYDNINKVFYTNDKTLIKKICDTIDQGFYSELVDTILIEKDEYYEYYRYEIVNSYLEVDASATVYFYREKYIIDKETGQYEYKATRKIRTIQLEGNQYNIWAPDNVIEYFIPSPIVFDVTDYFINSDNEDIKQLLNSLSDNKTSIISKIYDLRSDDVFFNYREIVSNWDTLDLYYDCILFAYSFSFDDYYTENSIYRNMYFKDGNLYINNLINVNDSNTITPMTDIANEVYIKLLLVPKSWSKDIDVNSRINIIESYLK